MQHPWFRTAMPKGLDALNYSLVQSLARPGLQSVEEIEQIVQAATKLGSNWNGEVIYPHTQQAEAVVRVPDLASAQHVLAA